MTGTLQNHSRKYQLPINTLDFSFRVLYGSADDITQAPEDGVVCYGMWMEGARWDAEAGKLADSLPGEMYSVRARHLPAPLPWLRECATVVAGRRLTLLLCVLPSPAHATCALPASGELRVQPR